MGQIDCQSEKDIEISIRLITTVNEDNKENSEFYRITYSATMTSKCLTYIRPFAVHLHLSSIDFTARYPYLQSCSSNTIVTSISCDRNQVSVSGTETKVQFRYRYRSRIFFFRNRNFFFQNFSNFLMFFCFLRGYRFLKAWN